MATPLKVTRREYKLVVDHNFAVDMDSLAESLSEDLHDLLDAQPGVKRNNRKFKASDRRRVVFLDTADRTLEAHQLLLRERDPLNSDRRVYTLKCRSPDRYIAAAADVATAGKFDGVTKFEEDIAAPFLSRYSHSSTIESRIRPESLRQAVELFPSLKGILRTSESASEAIVEPVNSREIHEHVYKGLEASFENMEAEFALIVWADAVQDLLIAEVSFRYGSKAENYEPSVATSAMGLFLALQRQTWARPDGGTKTRFAFES